nr:unnamed protein product [Callosobruchus analis]CAI5864604.1 unnamed protein product [Callosobruchus analis]
MMRPRRQIIQVFM